MQIDYEIVQHSSTVTVKDIIYFAAEENVER
jgi:hypothetical protein